jgi:SAM-dependent methyltransferase
MGLQLEFPADSSTIPFKLPMGTRPSESDWKSRLGFPPPVPVRTAVERPGKPAQEKSECERSRYAPPGSVWHGEDADLLERVLSFYPRKFPKRILDATVNGGRFWRGTTRKVIGIDIESCHRPTIIADNTRMPFRDRFFDVVVYDPPHIPNQGKDKSKDFNTRFGLGTRSPKEKGYTFAHTYPPFVREAYRVLKPEGILLCKIADYVHDHRYQWAHIDLLHAARAVGFQACDCIIKVRKGPIIDPKWKVAHHSRRQHCYWLVFRKSKKCE